MADKNQSDEERIWLIFQGGMKQIFTLLFHASGVQSMTPGRVVSPDDTRRIKRNCWLFWTRLCRKHAPTLSIQRLGPMDISDTTYNEITRSRHFIIVSKAAWLNVSDSCLWLRIILGWRPGFTQARWHGLSLSSLWNRFAVTGHLRSCMF